MSADPTDRLRRLVARLPELGDEDGQWLAERLAVYLSSRATSLDDALGLRPEQSFRSWRRIENRRRRDALIRRLAGEICPNLSRHRQAQALAAELRRYQTTAWVRHRCAERPPEGCTGVHVLLFEILSLGEAPIRWRALWEVLSGSDFAGSNPFFLQTQVGTIGASGNNKADDRR